MSKTSRTIVVLIIILAVVAWAIYPRMDEFFPEDTPKTLAGAPQRGSSAIPVEAVLVTEGFLENKIKVTGSIIPNEFLELKSEVAGLVTQIHFQEGQKVKKGDLLVSLKDDELQAQLEKLKFSKKLAEDREKRQKQLLEKGAISQEEYDVSLTAVNTIEADIKVVNAQIAKTSIIAPFSGTLGLRGISEGAYITSNTIITNFYNINPVKIEFSIPGKYAAEVGIGDEINFQIESSGEDFRGRVYAIEPRIDQNTRTLRMRALSSNEEGKLLPGQFARIELIMSTIDGAMMVPAVSVIPELNGHKLFLAKSGKVVSQTVTIGLRTDNEVQIVEGISPRDTVITTGLLQIRQGSSISISHLTQ
jgi:membrane fusion protein (multidrug efflux system)